MGIGQSNVSFMALHSSQVPASTLPRVAAFGRSNVGKSSLLNALTHPKKLFRSGSTPGLTKGLIAAEISWGQPAKPKMEIVDLPGFGFSRRKDNRENWEGLSEALEVKSTHGLLYLWLVDPKREPDVQDSQTLDWLYQRNFLLVFSKSDRLSSNEKQKASLAWKKIGERATEGTVFVSAQKNQGLEALQKIMRSFCKQGVSSAEEEEAE